MAGINFKAFDLGGHEIARRVWKDYYAKASSRQGERRRGACDCCGLLACGGQLPCWRDADWCHVFLVNAAYGEQFIDARLTCGSVCRLSPLISYLVRQTVISVKRLMPTCPLAVPLPSAG